MVFLKEVNMCVRDPLIKCVRMCLIHKWTSSLLSLFHCDGSKSADQRSEDADGG